MEALIDARDELDAYKRLAVIKYLQYLGARQDVLRLVFAMKNAGANAPDEQHQPLHCVNETLVFDTNDQGLPGTADNMIRLPRGEAVRLYALPGHALDIRLATHAFKLVNDNGWILCESDGTRHRCPRRQTSIGRSRGNDINLDNRYTKLSRRHMIVEPLDDHVILVTDFSSHGTYTPGMQTEKTLS